MQERGSLEARRTQAQSFAFSKGSDMAPYPLKWTGGARLAVDRGARMCGCSRGPACQDNYEISAIPRSPLIISALCWPAFQPSPGAGDLPQISLFH